MEPTPTPPNPPPDPRGRLMNLKQVAKNFGVSPRTIRRWAQCGEFPPFVRSGQQMFWYAAEIENWYQANATATGRWRRRVR